MDRRAGAVGPGQAREGSAGVGSGPARCPAALLGVGSVVGADPAPGCHPNSKTYPTPPPHLYLPHPEPQPLPKGPQSQLPSLSHPCTWTPPHCWVGPLGPKILVSETSVIGGGGRGRKLKGCWPACPRSPTDPLWTAMAKRQGHVCPVLGTWQQVCAQEILFK